MKDKRDQAGETSSKSNGFEQTVRNLLNTPPMPHKGQASSKSGSDQPIDKELHKKS